MTKNSKKAKEQIRRDSNISDDKSFGDIYSTFVGTVGGAMGGHETKMAIEAYERRMMKEEK